jgi:aryl-alcohol dehydrogenase-like predicted oxidoreductase
MGCEAIFLQAAALCMVRLYNVMKKSGLRDNGDRTKIGVYERVAARLGLSLFDYTCRKTAAVAGVTSLVVGVSRVEQLEAAVAALGGEGRLPSFNALAAATHAEAKL